MTNTKTKIEKITNESVRFNMLSELMRIEEMSLDAPECVWQKMLQDLQIDVDVALYEQDQEELETLAKAHIVGVLG